MMTYTPSQDEVVLEQQQVSFCFAQLSLYAKREELEYLG